jgi:hypothetical protein
VGVLLAASTGVDACEITRDIVTGVWRGKCNLTIDPKGPRAELPFIEGTIRPITLKMPDLIIDKFKYTLTGNDLEVYADVVNIGTQTSFATDIGVTIEIRDPVTLNVVNTVTPVRAVPQLLSGARQRVFMTTVFPNASAQDWQVVTTGLVHLCAVFGPMPVMGLQACN